MAQGFGRRTVLYIQYPSVLVSRDTGARALADLAFFSQGHYVCLTSASMLDQSDAVSIVLLWNLTGH